MHFCICQADFNIKNYIMILNVIEEKLIFKPKGDFSMSKEKSFVNDTLFSKIKLD